MADDRTLDVRAVAERFAQSAGALDELTERLHSLSATSKVLTSAGKSLDESAVAIRTFLQEVSSMSGQLRAATDGLASASRLAQQFLVQTDTGAIASSLSTIESLLSGQIATLTEEKERLRLELDGMQRELGNANTELSQLKQLCLRRFGRSTRSSST